MFREDSKENFERDRINGVTILNTPEGGTIAMDPFIARRFEANPELAARFGITGLSFDELRAATHTSDESDKQLLMKIGPSGELTLKRRIFRRLVSSAGDTEYYEVQDKPQIDDFMLNKPV